MISNKYLKNVGTKVESDCGNNHNRHVSRDLIQEISKNISDIAKIKEKVWEYSVP